MTKTLATFSRTSSESTDSYFIASKVHGVRFTRLILLRVQLRFGHLNLSEMSLERILQNCSKNVAVCLVYKCALIGIGHRFGRSENAGKK